MAAPGAEYVDGEHQQQVGDQDERDIRVMEEAETEAELAAQSGCADEPDDDRRPDDDFPAVEDIGQKLWQRLRQDTVEDDLSHPGSTLAQRAAGTRVEVFDDLGTQLSEDAKVMYAKCQRAG